MFFEVNVKIPFMDVSGRDKVANEKYIVENCTFFAEAEAKMLQEMNMEGDVVGMKISALKEFVNTRSDADEYVFFSTLEASYTDDNGKELVSKHVVAVFAENIDDATLKTKEYMRQGMDDLVLVGVKKTKFVDLI